MFNTQKIFKVPDPHYKIWFDQSLKTTRIIKPNGVPIQVFRDMWLPKLEKEYIRNCIKEPIKNSNWVNRVLYYVFTSDGNEGFVPVPKYCPPAFQRKDKNPPIMFLYRVDNTGLYYFK